MQIKLTEILVKDLYKGYTNNDEEGVYAYSGKLNIRPKYQREFVYRDKQRDAVITTVRRNFPLNSMYWVKTKDQYEVLDGQQRTLSICSYIAGDFSIDCRYFHNLEQDEKDQILNYKLMVYICEGDASEKLEWFTTINTVGEPLTKQELRNAVYTGPWLENAKKYFSKTGCPAYNVGSNYLKGTAIRQDYLETAIEWIADAQDLESIEEYMAINQHKLNANELWIYFQTVINWITTIFPDYNSKMKGLDWGVFYNLYKNEEYDTKQLKANIEELMSDDDVTRKAGIYEYLLSNRQTEKALNIRSFTDSQKRTAFSKQKGICLLCGTNISTLNDMEADHVTPWSQGGKTIPSNLQMICKHCNRTKSNK